MNPKLMGGVVAIVIAVLLVLLVMWLVHRAQRQQNIHAGLHRRGDLTKAQEEILQRDLTDAMIILRRIRRPPSSIDGEIILIPDDMGESIDKLIERHEKNQRKVLAP